MNRGDDSAMPWSRHGKRVLVTGGAGFIGSHLIEHLVAGGCHVTVIDNFSTGRRSNLDRVPDASLVVHDGTVSDVLPTLSPQDYDVIYHLAAAVGVRLVVARPIHTIETNVMETSAMLAFAAENATPILIASTSEVYGKSTKTPFSEDDDVVYGPTIYNRWSYACSKAIDEYLSLAYANERGLPARVVRFFNTVGPRQVGSYGMVLPRFVRAALQGESIEIHGDGEQTRCFCDVRDVIQVLPKLMAEPACAGRIFNIGSDEPISIRGLAERVLEVLDVDVPLQLVSYEQAFGKDFDDLRHRQPNVSRVREAVGFEPTIPLEQTIRDLADVIRSDEATEVGAIEVDVPSPSARAAEAGND